MPSKLERLRGEIPVAARGRSQQRPSSDTRPAGLVGSLLPSAASRAFFRWSFATYLTVTGLLLLFTLHRTDGQLVYALDDPAIHQSIAENLAYHGTWGPVPGEFQSASSAPLWTLMLALFVRVLPFAADAAALILNILAATVVLLVLSRVQRAIHPRLRRPIDVVATAGITVAVLYLPAATFVGMEHLVHLALVLLAVHGLLHAPEPGASRARRIGPYVLLALATLTRFETAFVALGLGVALMAQCLQVDPAVRRDRLVGQLRRVILIGLASAAPLALFALFNRVMGQGWLPNSVIAKSGALNGKGGLSVEESLETLTSDPLLAFTTTTCAILAVLGWQRRRLWFVPASTVVVATLLQVTFADVGWYERYQLYLLGLGVYAVFVAARDIPGVAPGRRAPVRLAPVIVAPLLLLSLTKFDLTVQVPRAAADTYQQRYQAGRFLERYYQGRPVATGELGYISLDHEGPLTDLFGLGDYEVLKARRDAGGSPSAAYWFELGRQRGFPVAAVYPHTLFLNTPDEWILVGSWYLPRRSLTAYQRNFQFWATTPAEVAPLKAHLRAFEDELPGGVRLELNEFADSRAQELAGG